MKHTPVYLKEVIEALEIEEGKRYIDGTYGEGGHTKEIVAKGGRVLAMDWDEDQIRRGEEQFKNQGSVEFAHGNFADIERVAKEHGFDQVDGILLDLGLSMGQLAHAGKGLSFKNSEEVLDMRLTKEAELPASEMLRLFTVDHLYTIFAQNSEIVQAHELAKLIVEQRKIQKITHVGDLILILDQIGGENAHRLYAQVFQALRIEVNNETESLRTGLEGAKKIVKIGGKIVVITFQSREDRLVKMFGIQNKEMFDTSKIKKRNPESFERSATVRVFTRTH